MLIHAFPPVKTSNKKEAMIMLTHAPSRLNCGVYTVMSCHIKERQNGIYCLTFLKKKIIGKIRLCFLAKITIC